MGLGGGSCTWWRLRCIEASPDEGRWSVTRGRDAHGEGRGHQAHRTRDSLGHRELVERHARTRNVRFFCKAFYSVDEPSSIDRLGTCTGIMVTCWLYVSVRLLDAAAVSPAAGWLTESLAASVFLAASHSAERERRERTQTFSSLPVDCFLLESLSASVFWFDQTECHELSSSVFQPLCRGTIEHREIMSGVL